jgi:SAM-dependent methyltransferase
MNQDKLWEAFQNDPLLRATFRANQRFRTILARVKPGQRLLNVGIGDGTFEAMALARGVDVCCLDPSARSIESLRQRHGLGAKAQVGYADAMPFADGTFDVVVMSEVIEHLQDETMAGALREVKRVLRLGGHFVGTVPADEDLAASQVVCPHCGKQSHRWGHVQSFGRDRLISLLTTNFGDVEVSRHYFSDIAHLNWKGMLSAVAKRLLVSVGVRGGGETFMFVARRR